MTLRDKVALITGAASGIGRATAERMANEGAAVIVADIDEANGKAVAEGIGAEFARLDVGDAVAWGELVSELQQRHGGIDIVYLNAGIATLPATAITGSRPTRWRRARRSW